MTGATEVAVFVTFVSCETQTLSRDIATACAYESIDTAPARTSAGTAAATPPKPATVILGFGRTLT